MGLISRSDFLKSQRHRDNKPIKMLDSLDKENDRNPITRDLKK